MIIRSWTVLALLLINCTLASAASFAPWREEIGSSTLTLTPPAFYETASLKVRGPEGSQLWRGFSSGEVISVELVEREGAPLADGLYRYELRIDGKASQWGRFRIEDGEAGPLEAAAEQPAETGEPTHPPLVGVEHHFSEDLGTSKEFCTGCSSIFEPGNGNFGGEPLMLIDGDPGIDFLVSESTDDLYKSWELGITASGFQIKNPADLATGIIGQLTIERGAPLSSLHIEDTGHVGLGTALPDARLHVDGNIVVEGDVSLGSSRQIKHRFEPVDGAVILGRLRELPIARWSYMQDTRDAVHLGPMAEDFHAAFGLGRDQEHISPLDGAGVALAAIQELNAELERQRRQNRVQWGLMGAMLLGMAGLTIGRWGLG